MITGGKELLSQANWLQSRQRTLSEELECKAFDMSLYSLGRTLGIYLQRLTETVQPCLNESLRGSSKLCAEAALSQSFMTKGIEGTWSITKTRFSAGSLSLDFHSRRFASVKEI